MEKVNIILADEGIFHDIYTQQGFSPWEHPHNTRLAGIWAVAYALSVQNIKSASLFQEAHTPRELYTLPNGCNLLNFTPVAVRRCLCRDWWTKGSFRTLEMQHVGLSSESVWLVFESRRGISSCVHGGQRVGTTNSSKSDLKTTLRFHSLTNREHWQVLFFFFFYTFKCPTGSQIVQI